MKNIDDLFPTINNDYGVVMKSEYVPPYIHTNIRLSRFPCKFNGYLLNYQNANKKQKEKKTFKRIEFNNSNYLKSK